MIVILRRSTEESQDPSLTLGMTIAIVSGITIAIASGMTIAIASE